MNELHKQVREDAAAELSKMANALHSHAMGMVDNTGVNVDQLLKLALGGRTESIFKKAVAILAAEREQELLALYQKDAKTTTLKSVDTRKGTASSD